ncbi:type II toxin-antitoxin system VapC family toxin [Methanoplanus endosymbiosus]|uniref:Type II toxin-antitoxin system VapC family toxin n=1 Tax=Methanoplanus endosymbiosus TaxID=33865 RepID=A0A9E7TH11_9EURY|nr:type II toxin-antitoxin system VapC family toxin [Methanoplanus endosymbiosus]UUX92007.1 type II toxin-antitoxin system VapC family toxin [Methanoplanus endosymbiosus]
MIILDSTFLIDLIRSQNSVKHKRAMAFLDEILNGDKTVSTTFINVYELYKGAYKTRNIRDSINKINEILRIIVVLDHSDDYYVRFGELSAELEKRGTPIGKYDEIVAAIVLQHGAKIVTNNTKDFARAIPHSEIINH